MSPPKLTYQEFGRSIWRAVVPPLLLLTAHALVLSLFLLYWLHASERAERTDRVMASVDDLERLLVNMETGIRGYLLTHDDSFLDPFVKAKARIDGAFAETRRLVAEDRSQTQRLNSIEQYFRAWIDSNPIDSSAQDVAVSPEVRETLRERKVLMDHMRGEISQMNRIEAQRRSDRNTTESNAIITAIVGAVGISITLAIALALINRRTVGSLSAAYRQALDEETASSRQFIDLAEAVPQFIWMTDGSGRHVYFNRSWTEFTGRGPEDLLEHGWIGSVHEDDRPAAQALWEQAARAGTPFEGEYRLRRGCDGSYRWFLCRALPVQDADGRVVKWFGSCTDVEEQKQAAAHRESILEAERQARADLTRSARVKDEFLSTLSHELRTPMTAILGWTRLLRDPVFRNKNLDRAIDVIDNNARVQARLIDDLLDMNRMRAGKLTLRLERVELAEVIRAVVDSLTPAANGKKVNLITEIDPAARPIQGDKGRLQQVVWNLIDNAMRFTPAGGVIRVALQGRDSIARLVVSDTGKGIAPEFLPHVFERFRQADGSTTRSHGGLGLGLAIVKSLVEMHGGSITAASEGEGRGAVFTIDLPVDDGRVCDESAPAQVRGNASAADLRGKRILVVDDDAETAYVVRSVLEQAGADITTLHSATDALRAFDGQHFDLLISDIGMPGMDGYMFIRELRLRAGGGARVPAMALTAFARPEDRAAALDAGFDAHVVKPVDGEELRAAAATLLATSSPGGVPDANQAEPL